MKQDFQFQLCKSVPAARQKQGWEEKNKSQEAYSESNLRRNLEGKKVALTLKWFQFIWSGAEQTSQNNVWVVNWSKVGFSVPEQ